MSLIIEHINDKEWEKLYQFIDMPLEKVPVKAWYGREMQTMDLTGDGDEEEISAHPDVTGNDDDEEKGSQPVGPAKEPSARTSSQMEEGTLPPSVAQAPVPDKMGGAFGAQTFGSQIFGAQVFGSQAFGAQVFGQPAFSTFSSFAVPKPASSLFPTMGDASGASSGPTSSSKIAPIVPVIQKQMNTKTNKEEGKGRRRKPRTPRKKTRTMASTAEAVKKKPVVIDLTGDE